MFSMLKYLEECFFYTSFHLSDFIFLSLSAHIFRLFPVMRTGCKSLAINCTPSLSFFQLFIFIMIDTRWIDLAQFIENKGDFLFFHIMKNIHGGIESAARPPAEKLTHENFAHASNTIGNLIYNKKTA